MSIMDMTVKELLDRGLRVEVTEFSEVNTSYVDALKVMKEFGAEEFEVIDYGDREKTKSLRYSTINESPRGFQLTVFFMGDVE